MPCSVTLNALAVLVACAKHSMHDQPPYNNERVRWESIEIVSLVACRYQVTMHAMCKANYKNCKDNSAPHNCPNTNVLKNAILRICLNVYIGSFNVECSHTKHVATSHTTLRLPTRGGWSSMSFWNCHTNTITRWSHSNMKSSRMGYLYSSMSLH